MSLSWTPRGFAMSYEIQVATDTAFEALVVDEEGWTETMLVMDDLAESSTYHWRVRSTNEAGTGPWSDARRFTLRLPFSTGRKRHA